MDAFLKKTVAIGGVAVPLWALAAGGVVLLLILVLTGEGPGSSDWVGINNEG